MVSGSESKRYGDSGEGGMECSAVRDSCREAISCGRSERRVVRRVIDSWPRGVDVLAFQRLVPRRHLEVNPIRAGTTHSD